MATNDVWINGDWLPAATAALPVSDLSIQRGYGIFDFFKLIAGMPLFLDDHLDRFYRSAAAMHLAPGIDRPALKTVVDEMIGRNQLGDAGIKLTLTGGASPDGYSLTKPNLIIHSMPLPLERTISSGMTLITDRHQRQMPAIKTIDYLRAIWLQPTIKNAGADDVLYYQDEQVTECPRANFFIVTTNGEVQTPKSNILAGVTRKKLLEGVVTGYRPVEKDFPLSSVFDAAEAFITSTTKMIKPVVAIDGKPIGNGQPGPITTAMATQLYELVYGH